MSEFVTKTITYSFFCDTCANHTSITKYDLVEKGIVLRSVAEARRACKFHKSKGQILCDQCFQSKRKNK